MGGPLGMFAGASNYGAYDQGGMGYANPALYNPSAMFGYAQQGANMGYGGSPSFGGATGYANALSAMPQSAYAGIFGAAQSNQVAYNQQVYAPTIYDDRISAAEEIIANAGPDTPWEALESAREELREMGSRRQLIFQNRASQLMGQQQGFGSGYYGMTPTYGSVWANPADPRYQMGSNPWPQYAY